jgi:hypothetical protein
VCLGASLWQSEGQDGDLFEAKVKVLGEYVRHHVKEEEGELFPMVKKSSADLNALGMELEKRKTALLGEFDESAPQSKISPSKAKAKSSHARCMISSVRSVGYAEWLR